MVFKFLFGVKSKGLPTYAKYTHLGVFAKAPTNLKLPNIKYPKDVKNGFITENEYKSIFAPTIITKPKILKWNDPDNYIEASNIKGNYVSKNYFKRLFFLDSNKLYLLQV